MVSRFHVRRQVLLTIRKVLTSLWMEEPAATPFANEDIPMIELQPIDSSDDEDQNHQER
jgi:hypothetical protein